MEGFSHALIRLTAIKGIQSLEYVGVHEDDVQVCVLELR